MRTGLASLTAIVAIVFAGTAVAGEYTKSLQGCHDAIGERLGIQDLNTNYDVGKIKTRGKYRDMAFSVSVRDDASPVQDVEVDCRVTRGGQVVALEFDDATLPNALATQ
jgi:hypothetical protein